MVTASIVTVIVIVSCDCANLPIAKIKSHVSFTFIFNSVLISVAK
jgi:hypothetical protein